MGGVIAKGSGSCSGTAAGMVGSFPSVLEGRGQRNYQKNLLQTLQKITIDPNQAKIAKQTKRFKKKPLIIPHFARI